MTEKCQSYLRHIDTVRVRGSQEPLKVYTCDIDPNYIKLEKNDVNSRSPAENYENNQIERYKRRVKSRLDRNRFREKAFSN